MPTDLLTLRPPSPPALHPTPAATTLVRLTPDLGADLARVYLASYPPEVGAADLAEARAEIAATFAGDYGVLRHDASAAGLVDGRCVGCVMVVERSLWDHDLEGPFVIELFVDPAARRRGLGRALMTHAVAACVAAGDPALSLRFGEGTSPEAHHLYADLGFVPMA